MALKASQTKKQPPKKEIWKQEIRRLKASQLTVKAIAGIIGVSSSRIYKDLENGRFENATKKGPGKKAEWDFTKRDAINYVESFIDTSTAIEGHPEKYDLTPPTKQLKIPGWTWKS